VANTVVAPLSGAGNLCFFASANTDLIADISGYSNTGAGFVPLAPVRYMDTRAGRPQGLASVTKTRVGPGVTKLVPSTGLGGVPQDALGLSLNVTATGSTRGGFVSVFRCFGTFDTSSISTLNFSAGQTVANAAIVSAERFSNICVAANTAVDVIVDLNGYLAADANVSESNAGLRAYDTRPGRPSIFGQPGKIGGEKVLRTIAGLSRAVVGMNITVTNATSSGFATVWDCSTPRPPTSNINYAAGQTVANLVISPTSGGGSSGIMGGPDIGDLCVYASSSVDVIIDLVTTFPQ
jgi:hypothetical protein